MTYPLETEGTITYERGTRGHLVDVAGRIRMSGSVPLSISGYHFVHTSRGTVLVPERHVVCVALHPNAIDMDKAGEE